MYNLILSHTISNMATISKIIAFQAKFKEFMELQIKEIGIGENILNKIVEEEITKIQKVHPIEEMLLASAAKSAAAKTPTKINSKPVAAPAAPTKANASTSPTLTIQVSPVGERTIRYSDVAATAPSRETGRSLTAPLITSWGDVAIAADSRGGAGAPPPTKAAAPAAPAATADLPSWKVEALKEFTSFTTVPSKKGANTYSFHPIPVSKIHTSLFKLLTDRGIVDSMMEWIHSLEPSAFAAWLEDTTSHANFSDDSIRFTLATTMYKFIPFFLEHNLKENVLTHLIHCIGYVVSSEPMTSESCSSHFGLSPEDEPTEGMLREVAMIQAIQRYVLSNVGTLLESAKDKTKYKIKSVESDLSEIKVSFRSEEAFELFTSAMHYDRRDHGPLGRRVYHDRRGTSNSV